MAQFPNVTVADVLYGYILNPFLGYAQGAFDGAADQPYLAIVDGSETGQNNPIWPLLRKERAVEFMVVSDNAGTELSVCASPSSLASVAGRRCGDRSAKSHAACDMRMVTDAVDWMDERYFITQHLQCRSVRQPRLPQDPVGQYDLEHELYQSSRFLWASLLSAAYFSFHLSSMAS